MSMAPVSVTPSGVMKNATFVSSMHDGSIRVALASATAMAGDGDLFAITFQASDDITGDVKSAISFTRFVVNETDVKAQTTGAAIAIKGRPTSFGLNQNYPNPFNPSTAIRYALPQRSYVTLTVFNTLGQRVATLVNGEVEAGYHEVKFDASGIASGVYFYRIQAGDVTQTRKLCLTR